MCTKTREAGRSILPPQTLGRGFIHYNQTSFPRSAEESEEFHVNKYAAR